MAGDKTKAPEIMKDPLGWFKNLTEETLDEVQNAAREGAQAAGAAAIDRHLAADEKPKKQEEEGPSDQELGVLAGLVSEFLPKDMKSMGLTYAGNFASTGQKLVHGDIKTVKVEKDMGLIGLIVAMRSEQGLTALPGGILNKVSMALTALGYQDDNHQSFARQVTVGLLAFVVNLFPFLAPNFNLAASGNSEKRLTPEEQANIVNDTIINAKDPKTLLAAMNAADPNSVVDSGLIKALILSLKEEGVPNPEQYLKDGITHGQFIGAYAMMGRDLRAIHKDLSVDSDLKAGAAAILSKFKQLPDDQRDGLADGLAIMSQLVTHKLLMPEVKAEVKTDAPEKGDLKEAHAESAAPKSPEKRRGGFRNEGKGSVATTGGRNGRNQVSDQMNVAAQNPPKTSEPRIPERIASFDTGPAA